MKSVRECEDSDDEEGKYDDDDEKSEDGNEGLRERYPRRRSNSFSN